MVLEKSLKTQLAQCFKSLETELIFKVSLSNNQQSQEMREFLSEIVEMSPKIFIEEVSLARSPSFAIAKLGEVPRIEFAGLPLDQEFSSFILAIRQTATQETQIAESLVNKIKSINEPLHFETYVSLSCHNCSTVVQSLNLMASLNQNISHTMIESRTFQAEREAKSILAVPTIFLGGEEVASGRQTLEQLIELATGRKATLKLENKELFDVLIVGGGPAGNSAAIYSARKGIRTGMIVDVSGGKPMEIPGIENMIGIPYVQGANLMGNIEQHLNQYDVDIMKNQRAVALRKRQQLEVELANGAVLRAKSVIISTGVKWKKLNIQGEEEFYSKGVANCPHCDGPLFVGKVVAIIGDGNPAIEGALDLAGIGKHVYVFAESADLKAEKILQQRLYSLKNVTVIKNAKVKEIMGTDHVTGMVYVEQDTLKERQLSLAGVFIQIGLVPNTNWLLNSEVKLNNQGEIIVDMAGETNVAGVFAAGDCTNSAYKQIIIALGAGATAALGAFDYFIRH